LITHNNLFPSDNHLRDKKDLNRQGFLIFAKNLKSSYFHTRRQSQSSSQFPKTDKKTYHPSTQSSRPSHSQRPQMTRPLYLISRQEEYLHSKDSYHLFSCLHQEFYPHLTHFPQDHFPLDISTHSINTQRDRYEKKKTLVIHYHHSSSSW
jgi:hypothetical protein